MTTTPGDDGASFDRAGQAEIEGRTAPAGEPGDMTTGQPPAGPHAKPELTDPRSTAGTGALPSPTPDGEADPGTG